MSERTFGVEIECNIDGFYYDDYYDDEDRAFSSVENNLRDLGLNVYKYSYTKDYDPNTQWYVKGDGSLGEEGVEILTPILSGEAGFSELERGFAAIQKIGGYVDSKCGMHVHHGVPELVGEYTYGVPLSNDVVNLVESWVNNLEQIHQFVAKHRVGDMYCPSWSPETVDLIKNGRSTYYGGRYDFNIFAIESHGTIEVRLHEGTLNFDEAKAWILFTQKFIESGLKRKKPIQRSKSGKALTYGVRVNKQYREILANKAARIAERGI